MTRPATDDTGSGTAGSARKRVKDLLHDAWAIREVPEGWLVRAPMDDFWQLWTRIDSEWASMKVWRYGDLKK